jgi:hypothetical protein
MISTVTNKRTKKGKGNKNRSKLFKDVSDGAGIHK